MGGCVILKCGDVVRLKSGSPLLTVRSERKRHPLSSFVECDWFRGSQRCTGEFTAATLVVVDECVDEPVAKESSDEVTPVYRDWPCPKCGEYKMFTVHIVNNSWDKCGNCGHIDDY